MRRTQILEVCLGFGAHLLGVLGGGRTEFEPPAGAEILFCCWFGGFMVFLVGVGWGGLLCRVFMVLGYGMSQVGRVFDMVYWLLRGL